RPRRPDDKHHRREDVPQDPLDGQIGAEPAGNPAQDQVPEGDQRDERQQHGAHVQRQVQPVPSAARGASITLRACSGSSSCGGSSGFSSVAVAVVAPASEESASAAPVAGAPASGAAPARCDFAVLRRRYRCPPSADSSCSAPSPCVASAASPAPTATGFLLCSNAPAGTSSLAIASAPGAAMKLA